MTRDEAAGTPPRKPNRADLETFVHAFRRAVETEYVDGRTPPDWLLSGYDQARELCGLTADIWPAPWERPLCCRSSGYHPGLSRSTKTSSA